MKIWHSNPKHGTGEPRAYTMTKRRDGTMRVIWLDAPQRVESAPVLRVGAPPRSTRNKFEVIDARLRIETDIECAEADYRRIDRAKYFARCDEIL